MHVTYLRCKSYHDLRYTCCISVFFRTGLLKIIGPSLPVLFTAGNHPVKDTTIAEDLLKVAGRLPESAFVGDKFGPSSGTTSSHVYKVWKFKAWFIATTRRHAEMRADRPTCSATRVQRCDLWILSLFRIIWHGDASPCNALTSWEHRDNVVLCWYKALVIRMQSNLQEWRYSYFSYILFW